MSRPALPSTDADRLTVRHVLDLARRSEASRRPLFSAFLDERQLEICEQSLRSGWGGNFASFGGYPDAERRVLGFGDTEEAENCLPFKAVVFNYPEDSGLSHRDFLGSLMALGIKRELLGDILVGSRRAAVFVLNTALTLVTQMDKVGRCGVKITDDFGEGDIPAREFDEIRSTVASPRLDAVLANALRLSREKTAELIKSRGVMLNRIEVFNPALKVAEGDVFSVRGFGKFELYEIGGQSKKDRVFITIRKFR